MLALVSNRHECLRQAVKCRAMGSPFIASVLEAVDRQLLYAPSSADMILSWPGDPAAAALALRFNGALHALARRGTPSSLAALYRGAHDDFDGAIIEALSQHDKFIADWLSYPTQTNEVARAAAIISALMAVPMYRPMPFDLLELGTSCGLNLNLGRYGFELGSHSVGEALSPVQISPEWRGEDVQPVPITIASARGVDLNPLQAADAHHRDRLLSFTWADQPGRSKRLEDALQIAIEHPPHVDQGDAGDWLAARLAKPQVSGHCRAVVHTMFLQYLSDHDRQAIDQTLAAAGARATTDKPLAWIGMEWTADRRDVHLSLTTWPGGDTVVLAKCHPYGDWIAWGSAT